MEKVLYRKVNLKKDVKKVNIIFYCLIFTFFILLVTGAIKFDRFLYIELYILLSIILFKINDGWLTVSTLFWITNTIVTLGYLFLDIDFNYDPFLVVLCPFAFYVLGLFLFNKLKLFSNRKTYKEFKGDRWRNIMIILYFVSLLFYGYYALVNRSLLFGGNVEDGRVSAMSGNGVVFQFIQFFIITVPYLFNYYLNKKMKLITFIPFFVVASFALLTLGFRTPFFTMVVVMVIILVKKGMINFNTCILLFFALFFFAMLIEVFRGDLFEGSLMQSVGTRIVQRLRVGMWNIQYVFRYFPRFVEFQNGKTQIMDLLMMLPGPDDDFSLWLKKSVEMEYAGGGLAIPIYCSFYIDFGYPGMMIGMFIYGCFHSFINKVIKSKKIDFVFGCYLLYVLSLGGTFGSAILQPLIFLVIFIFAKKFLFSFMRTR